MSTQEQAEVARLLREHEIKQAEADALLRQIKAIISPSATTSRKKSSKRPQDMAREALLQ